MNHRCKHKYLNITCQIINNKRNFYRTKDCGSWHVGNKLCDFIRYNVQYVMFIVAYSTQKLQFNIS
jgi:hypothetical protein